MKLEEEKQKVKDHLFAPSTLLSQQALLPRDSTASGEETETVDRTHLKWH